MDLGMSFLAPIRQQQIIDQQEKLAPVELAQKAGQVRLQAAQTSEIEQKVEGEKRASALMAQAVGSGLVPSDGDATISEKLMRMASINVAAGRVTEAGKLMGHAATAAASEAEARARLVQQGINLFKSSEERAKAFSESLANVEDQASLDLANAVWQQQYGQPSPLAGKAYDPEIVEQMRLAAISTKDQAELAGKTAERMSKDANRKSLIQNRQANLEINEQMLRLAKEKAAKDRKIAGKDVGSPTTAESAAAERLIQAAGLAEGVELETAAFDVAAQARALRKGNPGMTMDDALRQALATKQAAGEFTPGDPGKIFGIGKVAPKYNPALPLPKSGKRTDLVAGKVYRDETGATRKWTGTGWEAKAPAKAAPTSGADDGGADDGTDDGEE